MLLFARINDRDNSLNVIKKLILREQKITILLIEDDPDDILLVEDKLNKTAFSNCELLFAGSLNDISKEHIRNRDIAVILLDLFLPDASGVECVRKAKMFFPDAAIVILTGLDSEETAIEMLREGAQNYLDKSYLQHLELERSIRYAIERNNIFLKLKYSESRFRALIEYDNDGIALTDENGVLYQCPKSDTVLGWSTEEIILKGNNIFSFIHPDDYHLLKTGYRDAVSSPGKPIYCSLRLEHRGGYYIWAEGTVTNMLHNPAVMAMVSNFRDITDRKKAEIEISKLNEDLEKRVQERTLQLEEKNNDLESFSYSVSHDLRSPLNSIGVMLHMLEQQDEIELSGESKEYISIISECTNKMVDIIDSLLSFSKLGRKQLEKTEVDMRVIVKNICDEILKSNGKGLTVKILSLPKVQGDYQLLYRV
jgi:PAS domain S-box-containing protein